MSSSHDVMNVVEFVTHFNCVSFHQRNLKPQLWTQHKCPEKVSYKLQAKNVHQIA